MKKLFNAAVFALLAFLVAERAELHAEYRDASTATCSSNATQVEYDALAKGFSHAAAKSQGDGFRSSCLVTGRGRPMETLARN
jgi:hypothetical protein